MLKSTILAVFVIATHVSVFGQSTGQQRGVKNLKAVIGSVDYESLTPRLEAVNKDIATKGLHDYPGATGKVLAGYTYGEYYDWDLYFENIYLYLLRCEQIRFHEL